MINGLSDHLKSAGISLVVLPHPRHREFFAPGLGTLLPELHTSTPDDENGYVKENKYYIASRGIYNILSPGSTCN